MSKQIIKQPDGKYAIFSSVTDSFTYEDLTREEVIEEFREMYLKQVERDLKEVEHKIDLIDEGKNAYYQFTMSYEEAKELEEEIHKG